MEDSLTLVRRRDASRTKSAIVKAAREVFAQRGFDQAGIREIASLAGADSSLISRYFGSKVGLFEAALSQNLDEILQAVPLIKDKAGAGMKIARHIVTDESNVGFQMQALAPRDAQAKAIGISLVEQKIMPPLSAWIGTDDAKARARHLFIICGGLCVYVQQFSPNEETIIWYGDLLQSIIDGSL